MESVDPFSPEEAPGVSLIVLRRIYDVLMSLLEDTNPAAAEALDKIHSAGGIVGALPFLTFGEDKSSPGDDQSLSE
jgi:hypothetical protein